MVFRSTEDPNGLSVEQAEQLKEIADMLFLQDDLRIRSASFACVPSMESGDPAARLQELERVQSVVAYCYAIPHETSGDPAFAYEHASMAILTPALVSVHLVRPEHHVELVGSKELPTADKFGRLPGYNGIYNFKDHFWVAKGSRLYPPVPQIPLNIAQDLSSDIGSLSHRVECQLLLDLLRRPDTATAHRIFTAIKWFNKANSRANSEDAAIVNLAIAFETLLGLPEGQKTERLADAVSLLLGRVQRLDIWVLQFYQARSDVVHEGRSRQLRFVATDSAKRVEGDTYHSLLSYGRQVFRLCVSCLLFGAHLAGERGLEEKLVTNQERFEQICRELDDENLSPSERLHRISEKVAAIDRYRFVWESGLKIESLLGAAKRAGATLIASGVMIDDSFTASLGKLIDAPKSADRYEALDAVRALGEDRPHTGMLGAPFEQAVVLRLLSVIWRYTFQLYFWVAEQRRTTSGDMPKGKPS